MGKHICIRIFEFLIPNQDILLQIRRNEVEPVDVRLLRSKIPEVFRAARWFRNLGT